METIERQMRGAFFLIFCAILFACKPTKKASIQEGKQLEKFDLQGHRGCRGLMPENTIPAFIKALELGVQTLEMDVVISADKQVVLSHEPFFNHEIATKPNGEGVKEEEELKLNLYRMDYAKIKGYDVGTRPHPRFPQQQKIPLYKPKLAEVFISVKQWCKQKNRIIPFFNIETKSKPSTDNIYHPTPNEFVELLMEVVDGAGMADFTIIQSFDLRTLQYLHNKMPTVATAFLVEAYETKSLSLLVADLGFRPTIFSPNFLLVNPKLVEDCRRMNLKLIPWTVNSTEEMQRLKKMGVDGLITDYPNLFKP